MENKDDWGTPWWLYKALNAEFRFHKDLCANAANAKHSNYYSLERGEDALKLPWSISGFCNPPYSNQKPWVEKAIEERDKWANATVMLIMADTSTSYFTLCAQEADEIRMISHRIAYAGAPGPARFASAIAIFVPRYGYTRATKGANIYSVSYLPALEAYKLKEKEDGDVGDSNIQGELSNGQPPKAEGSI